MGTRDYPTKFNNGENELRIQFFIYQTFPLLKTPSMRNNNNIFFYFHYKINNQHKSKQCQDGKLKDSKKYPKSLYQDSYINRTTSQVNKEGLFELFTFISDLRIYI